MSWEIQARNVGGILEAQAALEPGLNAVQASNWQGKSSFIGALQATLGVATPLMEGKDHGTVEYEGPACSGCVELVRTNGAVDHDGEPVLTDEYDVVRTRLFACLGEDNELRQAVREGRNLESILLRPLDFENIDERISDYKHEREQIDAEIERAEQAKRRLPSTQSRVNELEAELESLREQRESLATADQSDDGSARDELTTAESERERVTRKVDRLEESIEQTEQSLEEKRTELAELSETDASEVESELQSAQETLRALQRDKKVLESLHSATELVLRENRLDLVTEVKRELDGDQLVCFTCGAETSREDVEANLEALREQLSSVQSETNRQQQHVEELEARRERLTQHRRQRRTLESDIAQLEEKLGADRQSLETARERRAELETRIDELSAEIDESIDQLTDVESDIKYREAELESTRNDLAELQERVSQLEHLREQREEITTDLEELRNRKARIRRETREAFDEAMGAILERFETGFETARLTDTFELVVAREGREASLDALSEGELELLGFVTAMAGYQAFEVTDISPFILVDRIGGLSEVNLQTLVEYLEGRTDYLVFTTYPEHAADAHAIDPTEWAVTSRE